MRNTAISGEVRRRLLRAGFARVYADRTARELEEHWREIFDEGLSAGLGETDAAAEATKRLGSSKDLAKEITARLQRSSWLGRNATFAFAALALTLTILWWTALGSATAQFCGLFRFDSKAPGSIAPRLETWNLCLDWIRSSSYVALPWICCLIAQRYFCGWRAALWSCLILAIHNGMHFFRATMDGHHGNVAWGYGFSFAGPPCLPILAPITVFLLFHAWTLRTANDAQNSGPRCC